MTEAQESSLEEVFLEFFKYQRILKILVAAKKKSLGNGTNNESIRCQNEHFYKSEFISPNLRLSILGPLFS